MTSTQSRPSVPPLSHIPPSESGSSSRSKFVLYDLTGVPAILAPFAVEQLLRSAVLSSGRDRPEARRGAAVTGVNRPHVDHTAFGDDVIEVVEVHGRRRVAGHQL